MKNQIVADSVKAVADQSGLDSRFHSDLAKLFAAAFDAGCNCHVVKSVPLTDAEIALVRETLLTK
jgi:hypothetical protein